MTPAHLDHPVIIARSLSKTFLSGSASVAALRGISIDIRRGEVTLLRGPSGSGKANLLSIFGCILSPDGGSLRICTRNVLGLDEQERAGVRLNQIGFIFQGFNLFPTLRVWENVAIALDLRGVAPRTAKTKAEEVLARVGLADKCKSMPGELSGGQKQRVAIARAVVGDPTIVLADEPTAALDWESGSSVMALLRELAIQNGRAVVIVTHDERATAYADRIVTMRDGAIASDEMAKASAGPVRAEAPPPALPAPAETRGNTQHLRLAAG
jgi:putative ABC transport system ATP-binding protein